MTPATKKELWRLGIASYAAVASGHKWIPYSWLRYLSSEILTEILKGGARIIVNAPPRHGKSEFCSKWLPTWYLDNFPERRVMINTYGAELAYDFSRKVRDEFLNNPLCWTKLNKESTSVARWHTVDGGGMIAGGVGGPITGRGADLGIIDDPHKDFDEAQSEAYRKRVIDWYQGTFYTRLEPNASVILIQTRWHEEDLTGHLLKNEPRKWKVIRFPALAEEKDVLGRDEDEALCPERYPQAVIQEIHEVQGSYKFAGQFQQRPAPLEGGMVKKDWFGYYSELPKDLDEWIQTWDLTFKPTGTSYVSGQVWCRKGADYYKVDRIKEKLEFTEQVSKIKDMSRKWPETTRKLIEDAADAQAVKSTLKSKISGIILVPPKGSKEARLANVSGMIESGNVFLPRGAPWIEDFLLEVCNFPNAANDDQVDAMTLALNHFQKNKVNSLDIELPNFKCHKTLN
jgi:predicted phage terminase large subunit-like protein